MSGDASVLDLGHQPKTIPLGLEDPVLAVEWRIDERRQHGLQGLRHFGRTCHRGSGGASAGGIKWSLFTKWASLFAPA
jgi:hypothetical protein